MRALFNSFNGVLLWLGKSRDATPLAVFRVLFFTIMLWEVTVFESYSPLLIDAIPDSVTSDWDVSRLFLFWKFVLGGVILGFGGPWLRMVNWALTVAIFNSCHLLEYHMFYFWTSVSFISIFASLNRVWSVDNIIRSAGEARISGYQFTRTKFVANFDFFLILFFGAGVVYFDSVLFKLADEGWKNGLGLWRPANIPSFAFRSELIGFIPELVWKLLGYGCLAFELLFLLFLPMSLRFATFGKLVAVIGITMHLGIWFIFPIPQFAFGFVSFFVLLLPFSMKRKLNSVYVFYFDSECPFCCQTATLIHALDWLRLIELRSVQSLGDNEIEELEISRAELLVNIHGSWKRKGSKLQSGINVYQKVTCLMPVTLIIGFIIHLPGISHLGQRVYEYIARERELRRCDFESCSIPKNSSVKEENHPLVPGFGRKKTINLLRAMLLLALCLIQVSESSNNGIAQKLTQRFSMLNGFAEKLSSFATPYLGITDHTVFIEQHYHELSYGFFKFKDKNGGVKYWPYDPEKCELTDEIHNSIWALWSFRIDHSIMRSDFDEFWLTRTLAWQLKNFPDAVNVVYYTVDFRTPSLIYDENLREDYCKMEWLESIDFSEKLDQMRGMEQETP